MRVSYIGFHIKIIIIVIVIVIVTLTCPDACCESGQTSGSCCIFRQTHILAEANCAGASGASHPTGSPVWLGVKMFAVL